MWTLKDRVEKLEMGKEELYRIRERTNNKVILNECFKPWLSPHSFLEWTGKYV